MQVEYERGKRKRRKERKKERREKERKKERKKKRERKKKMLKRRKGVTPGQRHRVQRFVGWEGVGVCSYRRINFWYTRIQANKAAIKAMVMNRVGDRGKKGKWIWEKREEKMKIE